eukprot:TRINITY_DN23414_c1_g1_i1.p1 TRINITY_DN23414_c1_g1~~TRINITY_DN23414_c1_g1_i1.p1  ORF type:complete len:269 (-),score=29.94 TRINITY_DN23414_c1_g1_i1:142-948(-)
MKRLLQAYIAYSKREHINDALVHCFGANADEGAQPQMSVMSETCPQDPENKVIILLEDVAYSGTELLESLSATMFFDLQADDEDDGCKFKKFIAMCAFVSNLARMKLMESMGLEDIRKQSVSGAPRLVFAWEACGPQCWFERTGKYSNIYFDHKMADGASLGEDNRKRARGYVGVKDSDTTDKPEALVIPYIAGCKALHSCAVQPSVYWNLVGRKRCSKLLNCPYPPYKDKCSLISAAEKCGCPNMDAVKAELGSPTACNASVEPENA